MSLSPERKGRVTASRVGAILGLSPFAKPEDVLREMVREYHDAEREFVGNVATDWGNKHEAEAVAQYEFETDISFNHTGDSQQFVTWGDWLGATPDGIYNDPFSPPEILEVKCPYSLRNGGEFKDIGDQPHYYAQVQVAMMCAEANACHFVQWSPHAMKSEFVLRSKLWEKHNLPKLIDFYKWYLTELDNPKHLEPLRGTVTGEAAAELLAEYDAAKQAEAEAKERQKAALNALIEMAGESDAEVCGRKLTKVVREGSVSYAKAIKELAPDADLSQYKGKSSEYWRLS